MFGSRWRTISLLSGARSGRVDEDDERIHRIERIYGMFQRTFALPNTVDRRQIEASYENGVLTRTHSQG